MIKTALITAGVTLLLLEIAVRAAAPMLVQPAPSITPDEFKFWQHSPELGWELMPNTTGLFSNGLFHGMVTIDAHGNRQNGAVSTYIEGYETIFFIGDSTTASFEVDDTETVPAMLESEWRAQGKRVNVLNLGARGYGTDQSVRKALLQATRFKPASIIYMYADNDVFENNTLRKHGRRYGKGVYLRRAGQFLPYDYPVRERDAGYTGQIVFSERCEPTVYEETVQESALAPSQPQPSSLTRLLRNFAAYRALSAAKERTLATRFEQSLREFDVYQALVLRHERIAEMTAAKRSSMLIGFTDRGALRARCAEYFDGQLSYLLHLIRTIPSVKRVHVVYWPTAGDDHRISPTATLFDRLAQQRAIDTFTDLARLATDKRIPIDSYRCPGDPHFCVKGNQWIAAELVRVLSANL